MILLWKWGSFFTHCFFMAYFRQSSDLTLKWTKLIQAIYHLDTSVIDRILVCIKDQFHCLFETSMLSFNAKLEFTKLKKYNTLYNENIVKFCKHVSNIFNNLRFNMYSYFDYHRSVAYANVFWIKWHYILETRHRRYCSTNYELRILNRNFYLKT